MTLGLALLAGACVGTGSASTTLPADVQAIIENASGVVAEIVADGEVTIAEMERAALAARACIEESGVLLVDFEFKPLGPGGDLSYSVAGVSSDAAQSASEVADGCIERFYMPVTRVYSALHPLTEEDLARLQARFVECVRDRGVEVTDYATAWERADRELRRECLLAAER